MSTKSTYQLVKERALNGEATRTIAADFPSVAITTIRHYVAKAYREAGQERTNRAVRSADTSKPISQTHTRIGRQLSLAADRRRLFRDGEIAREAKLGTAIKVRRIRQGSHDLTLTELSRIAAFCETDVVALLNG